MAGVRCSVFRVCQRSLKAAATLRKRCRDADCVTRDAKLVEGVVCIVTAPTNSAIIPRLPSLIEAVRISGTLTLAIDDWLERL